VNRLTEIDFEPRAVCLRCRRPRLVCYCAAIAPIPTRTRVVLLQHPRESRTPIGTARMAHLALPNSALRIGLDFSADPEVRAALDGPQPAYVVFPHLQAVAVADLPRDRPVTLVVVDGTWWQAQKLLKLNPAVRALPHVAFTPRRPSEYRIRRQPADHCVSTIEALAEVLDELEPERGPFARLLDPFHAMIARQLEFQTEDRGQGRGPRRRTVGPRARHPANVGPPNGNVGPPNGATGAYFPSE
jgi:DTW domain-containing protein YfiP